MTGTYRQAQSLATAAVGSAGAPAAELLPAREAAPSRPLRVAYLVNQYPKVSHSFIRREILALERRGIAVDRISIRGWDDKVVDEQDVAEQARTRYVLRQPRLRLIATALGVFFERPRLFVGALLEAIRMSRGADRPLPYHIVYLIEACSILRWLQQSDVAHVHAHFGTNSAEVAMLLRTLGGPQYSFTVHGPDEFDKAHCLGLDRKIAQAKFVVAVNAYCRAQLLRRARAVDWGKIKIVHCGLEEEFYSAPEAPFEERRFVCVGRLCEQKGQLLLLEAFSRLNATFSGCRLVLAGDGEMRPQIEDRIRALKLADAVTITGWIDSPDVRREILAARALVLPSFQESLPVVIMEAMALRRPVISTFVAGIPELVKPGETGWLVPAGDVQAVTDAMAACLLSSPAQLRQMGEAANKRVLARHQIDTEAAKLARLIDHGPGAEEIEEWHP